MASNTRLNLSALRTAFGEHLQENVRLANYTTARVGGPADAMLVANNMDELEKAVQTAWSLRVPFKTLGSGSNLLVSDSGYHGLVILNRARNIKVDTHGTTPAVWAESGANLGTLARQVALRGLSGLEWAATVPGSVGGAVYGNAGAFSGDIAGSLLLAEILHPIRGKEIWTAAQMGYTYRSSILKRAEEPVVVLVARFQLRQSTPEKVQATMDGFSTRRRQSQPPGASMGSMFKNPPDDKAGRLIEAAGLKGARIGGAEISTVHANFFINNQEASAADIMGLIRLARETVKAQFGVELELEVECLGDFDAPTGRTGKGQG